MRGMIGAVTFAFAVALPEGSEGGAYMMEKGKYGSGGCFWR